jgi:hypothetical protein
MPHRKRIGRGRYGETNVFATLNLTQLPTRTTPMATALDGQAEALHIGSNCPLALELGELTNFGGNRLRSLPALVADF